MESCWAVITVITSHTLWAHSCLFHPTSLLSAANFSEDLCLLPVAVSSPPTPHSAPPPIWLLPRHATKTAPTKVTDDLSVAKSKGHPSVLILLAVDTVDHSLLENTLTLAALSLPVLCTFSPLPGPNLLEFLKAEARACIPSPLSYSFWVIMHL